ncbi:MAG: hypothetical protein ACNA7F_10085 [Roseovarius sp.]
MSLLAQAEFTSPDRLRAHQAAAWAVQSATVAARSEFTAISGRGAPRPPICAICPPWRCAR